MSLGMTWHDDGNPTPSVARLLYRRGHSATNTAKEATQRRDAYCPFAERRDAYGPDAYIRYRIWWRGKANVTHVSGRPTQSIAMPSTPSVDTPRFSMSRVTLPCFSTPKQDPEHNKDEHEAERRGAYSPDSDTSFRRSEELWDDGIPTPSVVRVKCQRLIINWPNITWPNQN
jgi:hypothetical protein